MTGSTLNVSIDEFKMIKKMRKITLCGRWLILKEEKLGDEVDLIAPGNNKVTVRITNLSRASEHKWNIELEITG